MAAATVADGPHFDLASRNRSVFVKLTAPANGDTYNTGFSQINDVQITWVSGTIAAADAVGCTVSGGTVTFVVVGTARDVYLRVSGK